LTTECDVLPAFGRTSLKRKGRSSFGDGSWVLATARLSLEQKVKELIEEGTGIKKEH
jgi:hypothetical protein